jgi:hypothetical protein
MRNPLSVAQTALVEGEISAAAGDLLAELQIALKMQIAWKQMKAKRNSSRCLHGLRLWMAFCNPTWIIINAATMAAIEIVGGDRATMIVR